MAEALHAVRLEECLDQFWETVPPTWRGVRAHIRAFAAENYELSVEQFHILRHVNKGRHTMSELAEELRISRPAISQGVDGLVNRGLLARRTNPEDRRSLILELTPEGSALLQTVFEHTRVWMRTRLERLSPEELAQVSAGLAVLGRAFAADRA